MAQSLDRARLLEAFEALGTDLADHGQFVELAVYGGGALMPQFAWRRSTEDVGAVVRAGYDEAALAPSVRRVAERMGFEPDRLNDAVGMFTPLDEDESLFALAGTYPTGGTPGLRTVLATPSHLLAMKRHALESLDRGDRDLNDARALAAHLNIGAVETLDRLYRSIYGEAPPPEARDHGDWEHHLRDFLDAFSAADGDTARQATFIAEEPGRIGLPEADAFLGGVGEHLARRWGLPIPA